MNYLIINGQKSLSIQGLLIQSLPPISKPMMRSQIDEIDGRDGDIITPLGFKAYDRPVKIGLAKHFDIDEVIDYFNASGKVVFSNEPYKVYDFDILQQVDFERLIRFKQATVQFHCQPFKHSTVEYALEFTSNLDEVEVINNGNYVALPSVTIYGVGDVDVYLNDSKILDVALGSEEYITIDAEQMEAFKGSVLKNRLVTGDYEQLALKKGTNILEFDGNVSKVIISNYSRWI